MMSYDGAHVAIILDMGQLIYGAIDDMFRPMLSAFISVAEHSTFFEEVFIFCRGSSELFLCFFRFFYEEKHFNSGIRIVILPILIQLFRNEKSVKHHINENSKIPHHPLSCSKLSKEVFSCFLYSCSSFSTLESSLTFLD